MICRYDKTIYTNSENGFGIYVFTTKDSSVPNEARNTQAKGISFTGKGYSIPESARLDLELSGKWGKGKYGLQLEIEKCISIMPKTKEGIIGYLSSGLIHGIGPAIAERIVSAFGSSTFQVMDNEPEKLLSVKGITTENLKVILASYGQNRDLQEIMTHLSPFGITPKKSVVS